MIIYVNTANYRDYANTPDVIWDTIPVRVPDNFSGGATYDPVNMVWVKDPEPVPPTKEELLEQEVAELRRVRSVHIQETTILKDIDPEEYERLIERIKELTEEIKSKDV